MRGKGHGFDVPEPGKASDPEAHGAFPARLRPQSRLIRVRSLRLNPIESPFLRQPPAHPNPVPPQQRNSQTPEHVLRLSSSIHAPYRPSVPEFSSLSSTFVFVKLCFSTLGILHTQISLAHYRHSHPNLDVSCRGTCNFYSFLIRCCATAFAEQTCQHFIALITKLAVGRIMQLWENLSWGALGSRKTRRAMVGKFLWLLFPYIILGGSVEALGEDISLNPTCE